jgi:MFS family permease
LPQTRETRFFYGYIIVATTFLIMVFTWGINYSFGIFLKPMSAELGWSRATTSGAFSLCIVIFGLSGIITGKMNDRFGPRSVTTCCGFILSLGFILMSRITETWELYLVYGVLIGVGVSGSYVPAVTTISKWFIKRRGLMTGITVSGVGFGQMVMSPIVNWFILEYGWRTSYLIIGISVLVFLTFLAQLYKHDPEQLGLAPYGFKESSGQGDGAHNTESLIGEALRTQQFWVLTIVFSFFGLCIQAIMAHIYAYMTDITISATIAANLLAAIGGIAFIGRIFLGIIADRLGGHRALEICYGLMSAALLWLLICREIWMFCLFAVIFGVAYGGWGALMSLVAADIFGLSSLGAILGAMLFFSSFVEGSGPIVAGGIYDLTGSYQGVFILCAGLSLLATGMTFLLKPIKRKSTTTR